VEKKLISITDIDGIKVGHAQDEKGGTGCTVILCEKGAVAGCDVRGGGPATRDTPLLAPNSGDHPIYAVMLSGGSAFGLDACGGAMQYLVEKGIGFPVGPYRVPLTVGASVFDLPLGEGPVFPDKAMGYEACKNASDGEVAVGNVGAGTGCSAGKIAGIKRAMKCGIGTYGAEYNGLKIAAIAAVNAVGNVMDIDTGKYIAGMMNKEKTEVIDAVEYMIENTLPVHSIENTTISCIVTNARLTQAGANKVASIAHNGYARTVRPVHTYADGDTIFVLSTGEVEASVNLVGALADECVARAINNAAKVDGKYGLIGYNDINK